MQEVNFKVDLTSHIRLLNVIDGLHSVDVSLFRNEGKDPRKAMAFGTVTLALGKSEFMVPACLTALIESKTANQFSASMLNLPSGKESQINLDFMAPTTEKKSNHGVRYRFSISPLQLSLVAKISIVDGLIVESPIAISDLCEPIEQSLLYPKSISK